MQFETSQALELKEEAVALSQVYGSMPTGQALERVVKDVFPGKIALVSSFGTEAAVLLHMAAGIDPGLPVVFLDTLKHFPETLDYRDLLIARLDLTNVGSQAPRPQRLKIDDPDGSLHARDTDYCCHIRKTLPLLASLRGFTCWITGRKRFQADSRQELSLFDVQDRWLKFNPLADWTRKEIVAYFDFHDLPRHPLEAAGYSSIGCAPCTRSVSAGQDIRAGRWAHSDKTECGIHFEDGRLVRKSKSAG